MCYGNVSSISNNNNNNINNGKQIMNNNIINSNSIKDNFRTPLTPLHRGGPRRLHMGTLRGLQMCARERVRNCCGRVEFYKEGLRGLHGFRLDRFYDNTLRYAFSLIELSIVLIIIGLLVAGVTGGKSLIDSARSRALINELREYERAVWTFRAARDRFPGDVMNYGTFGGASNYKPDTSTYSIPYHTYTEADFPSDFITEFKKTSGGVTPDSRSAPFVDLYTEGIIDFKPLGNSQTADKNSTTKGVPSLKTFPESYFNYKSSAFAPGYSMTSSNVIGKMINEGTIKEVIYVNANKYKNPKFFKLLDEKIDDGEPYKGKLRVSFVNNYTNYKLAIDNDAATSGYYYAL